MGFPDDVTLESAKDHEPENGVFAVPRDEEPEEE
jgi:hypothetical protein